MLRASFENIIRNAIRFTPPGTPVEVAVAHTDSGRIRVTVEDHGPGVPEEMLTRIFEPFVRLDAGLPAPVEGVGLGLSIAKYTVEGCGGKISAFNRYGGGLQVVVELPGQPDVAAS
jgi:two-component system sensor histidine kinase CpxA